MGLHATNPHEQAEPGDVLPGAPPAHATGTVHHDAVGEDGSVVHHEQRFEGGRLVAWTSRDEPGPWALVRPGPPELVCPTGVASPEDVAAVEVRVGDRILELPPLDDLASDAWDALEEVPDATARLRFELWGSPVGRIRVDIAYLDGTRPLARLVDEWPEPAPDEPAYDAPRMAVGMTFRNYLRMRAGEVDPLAAIADGGDVADTKWTLLLLLHGLIQGDAYEAAYRSLPVLPPELGWWGEAAPRIDPGAAPD